MKKLLRRDRVEEELAWWRIPGVEVGAVRTGPEGQVTDTFLQGYGWRDLEQKTPMTADSLGGIASCSKAFTSAVIGALVDEGKLEFDRPIREYLPEFALQDPFASKECSLRDLLYHRTGIAGHDAMWPNPGWTVDEYIRRMRYLTPNRPFRSTPQYSNTMYDLAGFIAEKVSGEKYQDLVRVRILEPLGMMRTNLSLRQTQHDPDWAAGYFAEEIGPGAYPLRRMEGWDMDEIGNPAAGVNSCASEMLHWIALHLNNGVYEGRRLFSERVMRELHEPGVIMDPFPWLFPEVPGLGLYGMAWKTAIYRDLRMVYHCGEIEGYSSITMFLPEQQFGMFVLCNRHTMCTPFLLELVYTAIDRALGYAAQNPVDWAERLHPYAHDFSGSCEDWQRNLMPTEEMCRTPIGRDGKNSSLRSALLQDQEREDKQSSDTTNTDGRGPETAAAYHGCAGLYENPAYGQLRLTWGQPAEPIGVSYRAEGSEPSPVELYLHFKQWFLPLQPAPACGKDTFCVENLKEDTLFYTVPLTFLRDDSTGEITGFTLQLSKDVPAEVFTRRKG